MDIDVVLDAPASVSIYLQALLRAGRQRDAATVMHAHESASHDAAAQLPRTTGWSSRSELGMTMPYSYEPASVQVDVVVHSPPEHHGLHAHLLLGGDLNLAGLERALPASRAHYTRPLIDTLRADLGVEFASTSRGPEVVGVPDVLVADFEPGRCRVRAGASQFRVHAGTSVHG